MIVFYFLTAKPKSKFIDTYIIMYKPINFIVVGWQFKIKK